MKQSYVSHLEWNGPDPSSAPATVVDGTPVPEPNPPWPYSTWNIGGSESIGVDNMYYNALMDALYCGGGGQKLKDSRFTVYGWIEQAALYLERTPDETPLPTAFLAISTLTILDSTDSIP